MSGNQRRILRRICQRKGHVFPVATDRHGAWHKCPCERCGAKSDEGSTDE